MKEITWVEEYVKLLFPIDSREIDISKAQALKKMHTPKKLCKYRSFNEYSLDALKRDSLFLSKAANLNDPFECAISVIEEEFFFESLRLMFCKHYEGKKDFSTEELHFLLSASKEEFLNLIQSKSKGLSESAIRLSDFFSKIVGEYAKELNSKMLLNNMNKTLICALSELNDSSIMWSHYADEHKGFCIEYDYSENTTHKSWFMLNPIIYQDNIPDFSEYFLQAEHFNNLIATYAAMIKAQNWSYEKEWRLILPWGEVRDGLLINVPKPKAIYLGCRAFDENTKLLLNIAKDKDIPVYKMKRKENSFLLESELLQ